MCKKLAAAVVMFLAVVSLSAPAAAVARHHSKLPPDYAAWSEVARCESGGWQVLGSAYPDALGITAANYATFHGLGMPVSQPVGVESRWQRIEDIRAARNLLHRVLGIPYWKIVFEHVGIPDEGGCHGSW